jgi:hypothetical protein
MKKLIFLRPILMSVEVLDRMMYEHVCLPFQVRNVYLHPRRLVLPWCICMHRERTDAKGVFRYVPVNARCPSKHKRATTVLKSGLKHKCSLARRGVRGNKQRAALQTVSKYKSSSAL